MRIKKILLIGFLLCNGLLFSQEAGKEEVRKTIEHFFEGFHKQDSVVIKENVSNDVSMQTIIKDKSGKTVLRNEDFHRFLASITAIPEDQNFEEKLLDYTIQTDGLMAHAWVPYEFWFNGSLSHCGVNVFQLMNTGNSWKIFYIVDTRRKRGCL